VKIVEGKTALKRTRFWK